MASENKPSFPNNERNQMKTKSNQHYELSTRRSLVNETHRGKVNSAAFGIVLATLCASAQAEISLNVPDATVSIYGRVAGGLSYVNNIGPDKDSVIRAASNEWGTSLIGLNAAKELAPGIQGQVKLETGFSAANGNSNGGAGNLFSRFATVGVNSKTLGTIEFGRALAYSNDAYYLDPMGMNWSGVDTLSKGHNWAAWNNTVGYRSANLNGFEAGAQVSLGGQAGNHAANRGLAATLSYTLGGLNLRAIYDETRDKDGKLSEVFNLSKEYILGATYKIQSTTLFAAYNQISAPDAAAGTDTKVNHSWIGLNYQLNPNDLLRLGLFNAKTNVTNASAKLFTIGWDHKVNSALSLWASAAIVKNNENAAFSAVGYFQDTPALGATQTGLNAGFIYAF